jgi:hypothetical protein
MFMEPAQTAAARAEQELADRRRAFDEATAAAEAHGPDADVVQLIDCALALHAAEALLRARAAGAVSR